MQYAIDAMRYHTIVEDLELARKIFEAVKESFTYCELKEICTIGGNYYAKSIEIYYK